MLYRVTVTPNGNFSIGDYVNADSYQLDHQFVSKTFTGGEGASSFEATQVQMDGGIRQALEKLSNMRVVVTGSKRTKPMMTYTIEQIPGERPRIHQVETVAFSLGGGTQTCVLRGENFIAGRKATASIGSGTGLLTFTAARKGPIGEKVLVNIKAANGAGSVTLTHGDDGDITVDIVPAAGASNANAIAAQVTGASLKFLTAAGGGTGAVSPMSGIRLTNNGLHAGAGCAFVDLPSSLARTRLRVEFLRPGNGGNGWRVKLNAASGGGTVSVNTSTKLITVTPATGSGNQDASVVAAQINADTTALKYVFASVVGTNADDMAALADAYYMYGGCGEDVVATIGGATADVIALSDTALTLQVAGAALGTAGCVNGEDAVVNLFIDGVQLTAQVGIVA